MIETDVQTIRLPAEQENLRLPVQSDLLEGVHSGPILSFVRIKHAWVQAEPYASLSSHPRLASHLILLSSPEDQSIVAVYPVSTLEVNHNLLVDHKASTSRIMSNIRRCIPGKAETVYVVTARGCGEGPGLRAAVVAEVVRVARTCVGGRPKDPHRSSFWDGLGICTWESFGANRIGPIPNEHTKEQLINLVPSFPIDVFLIDDGWQDHNRDPGGRRSYPPRARLKSFRAGHAIRDDFVDTIAAIKGRGVGKVGVWMALQGYWFGIDPDGELAAKYGCAPHATIKPGQTRGGVDIQLELMDPPMHQWLPSPDKARAFWVDWFTQLKEWGVDFVKVDNQAHMEGIQSPTSRHAEAAMWSGVLAAVHQVFGSMDRIIMCMSHNERMFNGPGGLDFDRPTGNLVFRDSDDYNMPYDNPHGEFVLWNTRNSILTSQLSLLPDYDMFASNPADHRPAYHALLRCLSVGSVLLSDTPETDTDRALLERMTAQTATGAWRLARSSSPAVALPTRWFGLDLAGRHDGPALLAGVWDEEQGFGVLGAWNCRDPASKAKCHDLVSTADLEALGLRSDGRYCVVRAAMAQSTVEIHHGVLSSLGPLAVELEEGQCEAYAVSRGYTLGGIEVYVLGLSGKLYPFAALEVRGDSGSLNIVSAFSTDAFSLFVPSDASLTVEVNGHVVQVNETRMFGGRQLSFALTTAQIDAGQENWQIAVRRA